MNPQHPSSTTLLRRLGSAPASTAPLRIVLCPFGGGSLSAFRPWKDLERGPLDILLVNYPGRDARLHETGIQSVQHIASELSAALLHTPNLGRWLLVGHSIGAQIAFETCSALERLGCPPSGLVLSACHAPHLTPRSRLAHLPDPEFVERLIELGGCPAELRTNHEFRTFYLPMLRGDFAASERYARPLDPTLRLSTPALLLYGEHDRDAPREDVEPWQHWLSRPAPLSRQPGAHFYITEQPAAFLDTITHHFPIPANRTTAQADYYP